MRFCCELIASLKQLFIWSLSAFDNTTSLVIQFALCGEKDIVYTDRQNMFLVLLRKVLYL